MRGVLNIYVITFFLINTIVKYLNALKNRALLNLIDAGGIYSIEFTA